MEPLPAGVRRPPGPPRPPAPPTTAGGHRQQPQRPGPTGRLRPSPVVRRPTPGSYLREVVSETREVAWPGTSDLAHNAGILLTVLVLVAGLIALVDAGLAAIMRAAFGT
jgi:preprotein translocase subunit SecE